jgi:hypothetical protein
LTASYVTLVSAYNNLLPPAAFVDKYDVTWMVTLVQAISTFNNNKTYPLTVLLIFSIVAALFNPLPV